MMFEANARQGEASNSQDNGQNFPSRHHCNTYSHIVSYCIVPLIYDPCCC